MIYVGEQGNIVYDAKMLSESQKSKMVAVETIPEPETIEGKVPHIKANLETQEVYYVYEDIIPTEEQLQQQKIQELENALLEMSNLQAIKDAENEQAIMELTMMLGGM